MPATSAGMTSLVETSAPLSTTRLNYFSEVLIEVNFVLRFVPSPFTMEMIASEMPAAIKPYSMAVAPLSSFKNLVMSVTSAVPLPYPRKPFWIERRASLAA